MAVEIHILSGARQGERIALDANEFRVGADPGCEVFFDPQRDPAAKGRSVVFRLTEEGWFVRRTGGGEVLVNQQPVVGMTRVRSGDVVRMSELGPDFSFTILARGAASAVIRPAVAVPAASPTAAPGLSPELRTGVVERGPAGTAGSGRAAEPWRFVLWAGAAVAVCAVVVLLLGVLVLLGVIVMRSAPAAKHAEERPSTVAPREPTPPEAKPSAKAVRPSPPGAEETSDAKASSKASEPKPESKPIDPVEKLRDAAFLVQVEKGQQFWPCATAWAVDENTLLTTAQEAVLLEKWRREKFNLWVSQPATETGQAPQGVKDQADAGLWPVRQIRVHGMFAVLAEKKDDWIYANLALLSVDGPIPPPRRIELAASDELAEVEAGYPVSCVGYTYSGKRLTRYRKAEFHRTEGEVSMITARKDLPGSFRLLHLTAALPPNAAGSAVVNKQGRLIALFGVSPDWEKAPAGTPRIENLQYAPVVDGTWLRDPRLWQAPVLAQPAAPEAEPPQTERPTR